MKKFKKLNKREKQILITTLLLMIGLVIFGTACAIFLKEWSVYISG